MEGGKSYAHCSQFRLTSTWNSVDNQRGVNIYSDWSTGSTDNNQEYLFLWYNVSEISNLYVYKFTIWPFTIYKSNSMSKLSYIQCSPLCAIPSVREVLGKDFSLRVIGSLLSSELIVRRTVKHSLILIHTFCTLLKSYEKDFLWNEIIGPKTKIPS